MQTECGIFRFGAFEVDLRTEELRKHGTRLRLPRQSFAVLALLLNRPGELVTREALREKLWPADTFVDFDHGLNAAVNRLRETLGDSSEAPRFVETLPRRGYRFIASLDAPGQADPPKFNPSEPSVGKPAGDESEILLPASPKSSGRRFLQTNRFLISALSLLVLALALGCWRWIRTAAPGNQQVSHADVIVTPFTSYKGQEVSPAFSPDGNQIVFAWDGGNSDRRNRFDLYVKVIGSESLLRLTFKPSIWLVPAWSPDGRTIAFIRKFDGGSGIFSVPAIGGIERKLADANPLYSIFNLGWSPNGKELAYDDYESSGGTAIRVLSVETGEVRRILTPGCDSPFSPVFSPDGQGMAFSCGLNDTSAIFTIPLIDGSPRLLTTVPAGVSSLNWSEDGKRIIVSHFFVDNLSEVSSQGGKETALLFAKDAEQPAVARQGNRLAYACGRDNLNLWKLDLKGKDTPQMLISSTRAQRGPDISPSGKSIAFESDRLGWEDIWVSNFDGSNPVQLTDFHSLSGTPRWSPDEKTIVFDSKESGVSALYWIDPQARLPHKISMDLRDASVPSWSRDGRWIYFTSAGSNAGIYKISPQGGKGVLVTRTVGYNVQEGADGSLYFMSAIIDGEIRVIPKLGRKEATLANMPRLRFPTDWALAKNGIYFIDRNGERATLSFFDSATKKRRVIAGLQNEPPVWGGMALSRDERWLVYAQTDEKVSDIMLAEHFR